MRKAASCGEILKRDLAGGRGSMSSYALLGSVFHHAVADPDMEIRGGDRGYWYQLLRQYSEDQEYTRKGKAISEMDLIDYANSLVSGEGILPAKILAKMVRLEIMGFGWDITEAEINMRYTDVGEHGEDGYGKYPIVFDGTIDILMSNREGKLGIVDIKTTGLWDRTIKGKGSIKGQSWGDLQLRNHRQLKHYDWLFNKLYGKRVSSYGLSFPANFVPYKTGAKKGQMRGNGLFLTRAEHDLSVYEQDIKRHLSIWSLPWGLGRDYPEIWGKTSCPTCKYYLPCMGGASD